MSEQNEQQQRYTGPSRATASIFPIDTSGCRACTESIYALQSPRFAARMRAAGIEFARTPRHADIVLITGALSQAARESVARVLAAVPEPRALVAVGNCAIDGCVFAGSPEIDSNAAETLDVHVELPGCPPEPSAVLAAVIEAKRLLAGADADEAEDGVDPNATGEESAETEGSPKR
jgi:membrane-bound hydrogenase subunit mbhJ